MESERSEQDSRVNELLEEIVKVCRLWIVNKKVGNVQLNFFKGNISSYKIEETRKLPNT